MDPNPKIDEYLAGPALLERVVTGMTDEQLRAAPVAGRWSTLQVVCHLADFEIVYADRLARVLAENEPTLFGGDPDQFAARLAYNQRDVGEELALIRALRNRTARILRAANFARRGLHNEAGPLTLAQLLDSVTGHILHHIGYIEEKRQALGL